MRKTAVLKKFVSIKNIGRFRDSAARGNPELSRYTLIVGANGIGKTTICAVLRSLKHADPDHILGRHRIGAEDPPTVEMLCRSGLTRFNGVDWSAAYPNLAIFDDVFISENVHSGEVVEIGHRRNLYRVIVGEEGVRLAEEEARLAKKSRKHTGQITATERAIQSHMPVDMSLRSFVRLPADPTIDDRIAEQLRSVKAIRQSQLIHERPLLSEITVPSLPDGLEELLSRTIDDIAQDAETRLSEHLAAHGMAADGSNWIAKGMDQVDGETCPFCGQNIRGLSLIAAYRSVFGEGYKALRADIIEMRNEVQQRFGDAAIGNRNSRIVQNKAAVEFWSRYCTIDLESVAVSETIREAIGSLGKAAISLLKRKARTPLERISPDSEFNMAAAAYRTAKDEAHRNVATIRAINSQISAKKDETETADLQSFEDELTRRQAIKIRHTDRVADFCDEFVRLSESKAKIDRRKEEIRVALGMHTKKIVKPFEERINRYLDAFNAGFLVAETKHGYPGGIAASAYQLVIGETPIKLGDGSTPTSQPSFKNTLSAGDRRTLALAFFLTNLELDQNAAKKTVAFDDPFNSQDAFRRRQTVHEIAKVARKCAQVIVLSHDATFLKQVWDKASPSDRVALTLADHRTLGTKIMPVDLERVCKGRTATDMDELQTYYAIGEGESKDIIRKLRAVLETYCWTTYPNSFQAGRDWLGDIVRKIRDGGERHPAHALYDELDQINDYTGEHHHGEDITDATPDQIDPRELSGYVKRTLRIVNALQA